MNPNGYDYIAQVCKALSHPARIQILEYLKEIDSCFCGDIVKILPLSQSTVSQHLKQLKDAKLIKGEIEGVKTCYCVNKEELEKFRNIMNKTLENI